MTVKVQEVEFNEELTERIHDLVAENVSNRTRSLHTTGFVSATEESKIVSEEWKKLARAATEMYLKYSN